jgi:hypothetical protein
MSIINRPPEMVKREYELQEPIAVAVEKYATFIQSTPDHVVDSALKIVIGEMWSSAAGSGPGKGQNFLSRLARYINPQANALRNTALAGHPGTRPIHGHRDRGCCTSEKSKPELCRIGIT